MNKIKGFLGLMFVGALVALGLGIGVGIYAYGSTHRVNRGEDAYVMHRSLFSQREFFEQAYVKAIPVREFAGVPRGGIVNHHLLSLRTIVDILHQFHTDKPVTVVVLSPDHFFAGKGRITTTFYDWKTPYGILSADAETITIIARTGMAVIDPVPFDHEHGVSGIVPLIKKELPQARIIPIIFKDTLSIDQAREFARAVAPLLPDDAIVIASLDFSHNAPSSVAETRDKVSKKVVQEFDYAHIMDVSVDSRPALAVVLQLLDEYGARRFELFENTNSAKLIGKDIPDATSYITGVFVVE
ncbi:MAG TPA: AmmeMemoRadiSam system protein B [Candidatus Jacksonbacteria bacterium]|nr:MAG: AmmeMemoRadiSam system protein B [Candidatus Jacksonbacteria bacterium RIFCSPLOWO2_01_FULL_44_13]HAZ16384.1 AmmeMemoRadiSam system protein B [Candidatus Jacksonbacteria bacterium]